LVFDEETQASENGGRLGDGGTRINQLFYILTLL
jgi:hypothetical protein